MNSEHRIPILDLFFITGRIAFIVNAEDFIPPIKFEAKLLLDEECLGIFECYKEWLAGRTNYSREAFSIVTKTPLDYGLDYSKRKLEFIFVKELDHKPEMFSPLSVCKSLGITNFVEYLRLAQLSNSEIKDDAIELAEEYYSELREKIIDRLHSFETLTNKKIIDRTHPDISFIARVNCCFFKLEIHTIMQGLIVELNDEEFNNYICSFAAHISDYFPGSGEVSRSLMVFLFFEILSSVKCNIQSNNVDVSIVLGNNAHVHLGSYYEGNFYKDIKIVGSVLNLVRKGPLYAYLSHNYWNMLSSREQSELDEVGESFALELSKKYRSEIFINVCSDCGYVKKTPQAKLCLNCGVFFLPYKKIFS